MAVDCGHGGQDAGCSSGNLKEKDITLRIGRKVAAILAQKGFEPFLIRDADTTISLGQRTTYAHTHKADLFISIHANSSPKKTVSGIETFYFDADLVKNKVDHVDVVTKKRINKQSDRWTFLSKECAQDVHNTVIAHIKNKNYNVIDGKVKKAVPQVLLGFQGPAFLIETGYLTSAHEADLLQSDKYQQIVAEGICKGVKNFTDKHFA